MVIKIIYCRLKLAIILLFTYQLNFILERHVFPVLRRIQCVNVWDWIVLIPLTSDFSRNMWSTRPVFRNPYFYHSESQSESQTETRKKSDLLCHNVVLWCDDVIIDYMHWLLVYSFIQVYLFFIWWPQLIWLG